MPGLKDTQTQECEGQEDSGGTLPPLFVSELPSLTIVSLSTQPSEQTCGQVHRRPWTLNF